MSISTILEVLEKISDNDAWSLQLIKINNSKKDGTSYITRNIELSPQGELKQFVIDVKDAMISGKKNNINDYIEVRDYDGSVGGHVIYKLNVNNAMINCEYKRLTQALANPDNEGKVLNSKYDAFCIIGTLCIEENDHAIKLIFIKNPVKIIKHAYCGLGGSFKVLKEKILTLNINMDLMIIDDTIYMFNMNGEKLFNMQRAYKIICENKLKIIESKQIVSDIDLFKQSATSGHNPRKFISFDDNHLKQLEANEIRENISEKFGIPLVNNKFDTSTTEASNKLIKLLCSRGMIDPFDYYPMEVSSSKKWS